MCRHGRAGGVQGRVARFKQAKRATQQAPKSGNRTKKCAQFRAKMANPAKLVAFNKIKMFQKAELWSKKTHLATLGATPGEGEGSCRASD